MASADGNADREQYQAAMKQQARIGQLETLYEERLAVAGQAGTLPSADQSCATRVANLLPVSFSRL